MTADQIAFLNQRRFPFRITAREVGWLLGFSPHDIKVLTSKGFLKPIGKPAANSTKYFATTTILAYQDDVKWLDRATALLNRHWTAINKNRPSAEETP